MAAFSFLHAADIHLDSPLRGLSRYDGVPADEVRTATRTAFNSLVRLAIEREVAFVVIAGDLFDGEPRDVGIRHAVAAGFGELGRAGIPVYALRGNHDAASVVTHTLPAMDHVHWFDTRKPHPHVLASVGVALHGQGFATREVKDNLAAHYPKPKDGMFNIGVLHTALGGHAGHEPYAPCSVEELVAKGYDYWALGHVHIHTVVHSHPHVVFPGCLQGRSIREEGAKGAVLVEVEDRRVQRLTHLPLDVVRWAGVTVDVTGAADLPEVEALLRGALERAVTEKADGRPLLVRITFAGSTPLGGAVQQWAGRGDEVRLLAAGVSRELWVEKVLIRTVAPVSAAPASGTDLADLLDVRDPAMLARLQAELAPFLNRQAAAEHGSVLEDVRAGVWEPVIARAAAALRARLSAAG